LAFAPEDFPKMSQKRRILTGITTTGTPHLGNYVGAIRPLAELAADPAREVYVFVADLHALNGGPEPSVLRERCRRLAAALLACGLDRPNVHLYRQSRVPAVAGMASLLSNVASKGLLNRAHAYKAAVAANGAAGRDPDHGDEEQACRSRPMLRRRQQSPARRSTSQAPRPRRDDDHAARRPRTGHPRARRTRSGSPAAPGGRCATRGAARRAARRTTRSSSPKIMLPSITYTYAPAGCR
jgi:tRNA synthetase class I (W and Y)